MAPLPRSQGKATLLRAQPKRARKLPAACTRTKRVAPKVQRAAPPLLPPMAPPRTCPLPPARPIGPKAHARPADDLGCQGTHAAELLLEHLPDGALLDPVGEALLHARVVEEALELHAPLLEHLQDRAIPGPGGETLPHARIVE